MSEEHENLGPANSWHIRSVPEAVKQAIVDKAHAERISVADLLTRIVTGNPVDMLPHASPGNPVDMSPHRSTGIDAARLKLFLECSEALSRADLPRSVKGAVRAMIGNELRLMRKDQKRQARLAIPDLGTE